MIKPIRTVFSSPNLFRMGRNMKKRTNNFKTPAPVNIQPICWVFKWNRTDTYKETVLINIKNDKVLKNHCSKRSRGASCLRRDKESGLALGCFACLWSGCCFFNDRLLSRRKKATATSLRAGSKRHMNTAFSNTHSPSGSGDMPPPTRSRGERPNPGR